MTWVVWVFPFKVSLCPNFTFISAKSQLPMGGISADSHNHDLDVLLLCDSQTYPPSRALMIASAIISS
jgi:hypothetical protein